MDLETLLGTNLAGLDSLVSKGFLPSGLKTSTIIDTLYNVERSYAHLRFEEASPRKRVREALLAQIGDKGLRKSVEKNLADIRHEHRVGRNFKDRRFGRNTLYTRAVTYRHADEGVNEHLVNASRILTGTGYSWARKQELVEKEMNAFRAENNNAPLNALENDLIHEMNRYVDKNKRVGERQDAVLKSIGNVAHYKLLSRKDPGASLHFHNKDIPHSSSLAQPPGLAKASRPDITSRRFGISNLDPSEVILERPTIVDQLPNARTALMLYDSVAAKIARGENPRIVLDDMYEGEHVIVQRRREELGAAVNDAIDIKARLVAKEGTGRSGPIIINLPRKGRDLPDEYPTAQWVEVDAGALAIGDGAEEIDVRLVPTLRSEMDPTSPLTQLIFEMNRKDGVGPTRPEDISREPSPYPTTWEALEPLPQEVTQRIGAGDVGEVTQAIIEGNKKREARSKGGFLVGSALLLTACAALPFALKERPTNPLQGVVEQRMADARETAAIEEALEGSTSVVLTDTNAAAAIYIEGDTGDSGLFDTDNPLINQLFANLDFETQLASLQLPPNEVDTITEKLLAFYNLDIGNTTIRKPLREGSTLSCEVTPRSDFGWRKHPVHGDMRYHEGYDSIPKVDTDGDGVVSFDIQTVLGPGSTVCYVPNANGLGNVIYSAVISDDKVIFDDVVAHVAYPGKKVWVDGKRVHINPFEERGDMRTTQELVTVLEAQRKALPLKDRLGIKKFPANTAQCFTVQVGDEELVVGTMGQTGTATGPHIHEQQGVHADNYYDLTDPLTLKNETAIDNNHGRRITRSGLRQPFSGNRLIDVQPVHALIEAHEAQLAGENAPCADDDLSLDGIVENWVR